MKIIHISDIHFTIPGERMGGLNPHKRLAKALADVNENHSDAARIVITGDLTHWAEREAYDALHEVLAKQTVPVRLMIGNHDDRSIFLSVFSDQATDELGYVNHSEVVGDSTFIYLDSTQPLTHAGHFGADRCAWLEAELQQAEHARIFLHHNPMEIKLPAEDQIALVAEDRLLFKDLLNTYRDRIDYIHFGHVHAPIHGTYCGIPFASVPSTCNQSYPDMKEAKLLAGGPMEPAYHVLLIEGRETIIHQIPFNWDGPLFASGAEWEDWSKPVAAE
ncbi:metallophosphoesterase [Cognatishimia activa]|uniref:3',5'-cyclic adenosine monophosphate phosphodiesterase CpdA n=1 Tax=Cognatishimia activa TaxID=1715691 RepID=A0A0P1IPW8_9RHOB|nr:metallophosphoesterase [Cognatishimia activa]CUI85439.1 3',5'-cyclic adenosine monophosphate phosphodiesterase CpdA [Cognatishimia activa]CUK25554.1 3',5'-cyclic adenosine monophosphate phosphodiesterase CpdA [Cognatishimia activa]